MTRRPDISDRFAAGCLPRDPFEAADDYEPASRSAPRLTAERALLTRLADVTPRPIRWVWAGWLALGKISVIDGDPGLGKSLVTIDVASRISRGATMPGDSPGALTGEPAGVVLLTAEDDPTDTLRPRVDAAGGDPARITTLNGVETSTGERMPRLTDLDLIRDAIESVSARLVIIDPVMAYLAGDAHRDNEVRQTLGPLAKLASDLDVAVLIVRHLNKSGGAHALYRGGGSIGIIGAARVGMLIARDPDDEGVRVLASTKSNIAEQPGSLAYRIESHGTTARVEWTGPSSHDPTSLLATTGGAEKSSTLVEDAVAWLIDELAAGPRPAVELMKEGKAAGFTERTMTRAKALGKIGSFRTNLGGTRGAGVWFWGEKPTDANSAVQPGQVFQGCQGDLERVASNSEGNAQGCHDEGVGRLDVNCAD